MTVDREQRVRERAYLIWKAEGCPTGCEQEHWQRAEREIADELAAGLQGAGAELTADEPAASDGEIEAPSENSAAAGEKQPKRAAKRSAASSPKASARRKGSKTPT